MMNDKNIDKILYLYLNTFTTHFYHSAGRGARGETCTPTAIGLFC